jgi:hypothetical protein
VKRDDARPGGSAAAPARADDTPSEDEPVVIGALFLSMCLLIVIGAAWVVMFWTMLGR